MSLFNIFLGKKRTSASMAKERLQIIVSHERMNRHGPEYLPMLQKEILEVISKYVQIDSDKINVSLQKAGDRSVLELNVTLHE